MNVKSECIPSCLYHVSTIISYVQFLIHVIEAQRCVCKYCCWQGRSIVSVAFLKIFVKKKGGIRADTVLAFGTRLEPCSSLFKGQDCNEGADGKVFSSGLLLGEKLWALWSLCSLDCKSWEKTICSAFWKNMEEDSERPSPYPVPGSQFASFPIRFTFVSVLSWCFGTSLGTVIRLYSYIYLPESMWNKWNFSVDRHKLAVFVAKRFLYLPSK